MKTSQEQNQYKKEKKLRGGARGDNIWFFIIHNLISAGFFFLFAYALGFFDPITKFTDIFSSKFTRLLTGVFVFSLLSSFLGWIFGYVVWKAIKEQIFHTSMKSMGDLSRGINRFPLTNLAYYISTLLSTLAFSVGAMGIIEALLFTNYTYLTLFASYLFLKITIYVIVQVVVEAKF